MPGGKDCACFSSSAFTSSAICVALEPAICCTIPMTDGCPLSFIDTLYISPPSSTFATSFRRSVWPFWSLRMMMSSYSSAVFRRPLYRMVYSYAMSLCSPNLPGAASMFCSASAELMSDGMRLYCFIFSGCSQIRME